MSNIIQMVRQIIAPLSSNASMLLSETLLVCIIAAILGFILGKSKGGRLKGALLLGLSGPHDGGSAARK